jgi:hypothetical protein
MKNPRQELKASLTNESKLCYDLKEGKTSSIYTILDLKIKIRSTK